MTEQNENTTAERTNPWWLAALLLFQREREDACEPPTHEKEFHNE